MPYVRETMTAGSTIEVREYYTARYGQKRQNRAKHEKPTPLAMEVINHRNSERKLRGLIRPNFAKNDWFLTLRFKQGYKIDEATVLEHMRRFLRKMKTIYAKHGKVFKYIYVIELLTRTAHVHILLPYIEADLITECWLELSEKTLSVYFAPVKKGDQAPRIASYMLKEYDPRKPRHRKPSGAKIHTSRNIEKPVIRKEIMKRTKIQKAPFVKKGYILKPETYYEGVDAFSGYEYRSYTVIRS